jgi:hypothetical protein
VPGVEARGGLVARVNGARADAVIARSIPSAKAAANVVLGVADPDPADEHDD